MQLTNAVEKRGIEAVPAEERRGTARVLAAVWFAANIGILALVFGAILAALGLGTTQALVVSVASPALSFLLVGGISVAGTWSGMPALTLSRRAFGRVGNLGPAGVSWVSILGWETVSSVIAAWAILDLGRKLFDLGSGWGPTGGSLVIAVGASVVLGFFGYSTVMRFQRWATVVFGGLTVLVVPFLLVHARWSGPAGARTASLGTVVAAASIVAAGTGVSWLNLAPDYSRYLPAREPAPSIIAWVTLSATLPTTLLVAAGYFAAEQVHGLATTLDPVGPLRAALPAWLAVPYLLAAAGGMLAETDLALYSSGLNLLALGVRIRRSRTVLVDAAVVIGGGAYLMLGGQGFMSPFESFLELLADGLAAWAGVVLADMARARPARGGGAATGLELHYKRWADLDLVGVAAWAISTGIGLATTVSPWYTGPLARGALAQGSFGFVFALAAAGALSALGWHLVGSRAQVGAAGPTKPTRVPTRVPTGSASAPRLEGATGLEVPLAGRPKRLVLAGSILVDVLLYVKAPPERGGDVLSEHHLITSGGGFNVLTAAARLGLRGCYAGRIGDGIFGRQVARDLESEGIDAALPTQAWGDTGFDVGIVEPSGERSFVTSPGTESRLSATDLARAQLQEGDAVYVSGYDLSYPVAGPALVAWANSLSRDHLLVVDPGPLAAQDPGAGLSQVLGRVDVLSCSAREAALISGSEGPPEAALRLASLLEAPAIAVVRDGPNGCWLARAGTVVHVPGRPVTPMDTTGAGDVHVGAMLARLAAGDPPAGAAWAANVAASLSTLRAGGATGPSLSELTAVLGAALVRRG